MSYSLLFPSEEPQFNSDSVRPFECLNLGWQLVKDHYFLLVGMFLIIGILVTCIPFTGLIYGAWMIGIYSALLGRMRGEPASFNAIGTGFSFFSQGFVIALLSGLPFGLIAIGAQLMQLRFKQVETWAGGAGDDLGRSRITSLRLRSGAGHASDQRRVDRGVPAGFPCPAAGARSDTCATASTLFLRRGQCSGLGMR